MAKWIKTSETPKGEVFTCSKCRGNCYCIAYARTIFNRLLNTCDYEFCPHCGEIMDGKEDQNQ